MTLPITNSILRGELRPNIIQHSLEPRDLDLLIRKARKVANNTQLRELETAINDVLCGLVKTEDAYSDDRKIHDAAIEAIRNKIIKNEVDFKYPSTEVIIDNVLLLPEMETPMLRFYNTILDAEVLRTRLYILNLTRAIQDNAFMRSNLKELLKEIKFTCQEAGQWDDYENVMLIVSIKLTHLYFTILNTYHDILETGDTSEYEDDFMDFVYGWNGKYPSEEESVKYNEQRAIIRELGHSFANNHEGVITRESNGKNSSNSSKDKAEIFLDRVAEYDFLGMPMIKPLVTQEEAQSGIIPKKVHQLVMTMLNNPGHACAMLEHLKFYEWISSTRQVKFTKDKYDALCSKVVMGAENEDSRAFHTVRMSLKESNKNAKKYKAYAYLDQVANEYVKILNS